MFEFRCIRTYPFPIKLLRRVSRQTRSLGTKSVGSNVSELVGNTPIVRLNRITEGCLAQVYAKLEYMNPGGSVKDRIAVSMIKTAEENGLISPGKSVLVEATR